MSATLCEICNEWVYGLGPHQARAHGIFKATKQKVGKKKCHECGKQLHSDRCMPEIRPLRGLDEGGAE